MPKLPQKNEKCKTLTNQERIEAAKLVLDHKIPVSVVTRQFKVLRHIIYSTIRRKKKSRKD